MSVELIGYVPHTRSTETTGLWWSDDFDLSYIEETAQAHEAAGFDWVLVGQSSWGPDPMIIAAHVLRVTQRLKVFVAHRPGFVQPTVAARQAVTLQRIAGGDRVGLHIITGAPGGELQRDGDTLPDDERYRRTAEYIDVLRRTWVEQSPFDHHGAYFEVRQGYSSVRPAAVPAVSFAGSSQGALDAGPGRADRYMIWGEPLAETGASIDTLRRLARERGRDLAISVSLRAIIGETEAQAWQKAQALYDRAEAQLKASRADTATHLQQVAAKIDSVGARKLDDIAKLGDVHDERLWLGFTRLVGRGGSTAALVGTREQVVESYLRYYALGARAFYLRGWDIAEDARAYGRDLIPALRAAIAAADTADTAPASGRHA
ncbi:LLM class flavin-dependent oxidoreductase [Chitinasiproducens palmae]|uniref:Alkanesulfonate monooxygenase n=1 Tax=Chitinasiproducens palmae TaxID=1770053 RepID=A0A1H2PPP4_9BURK|nr:LLM class flavin-dependent oxidoreductase [Chitinasiproducens palmae]SDV48751.1 alkanesulfonate monooxygenase [Chitinasiproducens palmae]